MNIPIPTSMWTFNEAASPVRDGTGYADLTITNGTFNGSNMALGGANSYFNSPVSVFDRISSFSHFSIFIPGATSSDSDILACASGANFTADDYTWYFDTNSGGNGYYFGVSPGAGNYGNPLQLTPGSIDTTKKHWLLFGYQAAGGGNRAFCILQREGDLFATRYYANNMDTMVLGRSHYLTNSGFFLGGTINANYYRGMQWEGLYLDDMSIFQRLRSMYND